MTNTQTASYNESHANQLRLRHIFFPGTYGLVSELIIAFLALIVFNASQFSSRLLGADLGASPFSLGTDSLRQVLSKVDHYAYVQRVMLFVLWAVVGALIYILVFRALQILLNVKSSMGDGMTLVRLDSSRGLMLWLLSLHDFFIKLLLIIGGVTAVSLGSLVCFSIASQELNNAMLDQFPSNIGGYALSFIGAVISVRFITLGISLISRRFRGWYTA